jgi:hypothetical protein
MAKVYASLIRKGFMALEDIKDEKIRKDVEKILEA